MDTTLKYPNFRWMILLAILGGQIVAGITTMGFAPLIPDMVHSFYPNLAGPMDPEFGKAIGSIAFAVLGLMLFMAAIGLLFGGFLVDKFGIFTLMITSLAITALTFITLTIFATSLSGLTAVRIIQGIGGALFTATITPAIAIWFPKEEFGKAMGIQGIGMGLGIMLGLNIGPVFAKMAGNWVTGVSWIAVFPIVLLILAITVAILSRKYVPSLPSLNAEPDASVVQANSLTGLFKLPVFWVGMAITAASFWVGNAFNDLSPSFLAAGAPLGAGYDAVGSGRISSVASIAGIIGPVLGGILVDNIFKGKNRSVILIGWFLSAVCYSAIAFKGINQSLGILIPIMLLAGFGNPFISVTINAFAAKIFPPHLIGRAVGLWMSVGFFAAAIGVSVGSLALKSTGNYNLSFIIVGVGSVLGFILALFLKAPAETIVADTNAVRMPR